jgi:hypothetical protein
VVGSLEICARDFLLGEDEVTKQRSNEVKTRDGRELTQRAEGTEDTEEEKQNRVLQNRGPAWYTPITRENWWDWGASTYRMFVL